MKTSFSKITVEVLCSLFVLLLVYTAVSKLLDHTRFNEQLNFITQHQWMAAALSYGVPLTELAIAATLCINTSRRFGLYAFVGLLSCFTAWISYLLLSGRNLPCTCGGVVSSLTWKQHLVFNGCFLLGGIVAILLHSMQLTPKNLTQTTKSL